MITVVKRTGHSSYYVEKGMAAMGKTASQMGIQGDYRICGGGKVTVVLRGGGEAKSHCSAASALAPVTRGGHIRGVHMAFGLQLELDTRCARDIAR